MTTDVAEPYLVFGAQADACVWTDTANFSVSDFNVFQISVSWDKHFLPSSCSQPINYEHIISSGNTIALVRKQQINLVLRSR